MKSTTTTKASSTASTTKDGQLSGQGTGETISAGSSQTQPKRKPIKVFRSRKCPNVTCSVWDRQQLWEGETLTHYSAQPQRSYERDGEKYYTSSFDSDDELGEAIILMQDANGFINILKHPETMLPKPEGELIPE